jgi:large subunit ribosomal protein L29
MKMNEISNLSVEDLNNKLVDVKKELLTLRIQKSSGDEVKTHLFSSLKKDAARIKTLLNSKKN